jgi:hypothetical protein
MHKKSARIKARAKNFSKTIFFCPAKSRQIFPNAIPANAKNPAVISNPQQADSSPKVEPLRINLKRLILLQPKISPCGRDDRKCNCDKVSLRGWRFLK